jgi:type 1 glutamine amidotransferase
MRTKLILLAIVAAFSVTVVAQTPAPAPAQGRGAAPAPAAGAPAQGQRGGGQRDPNAAPGIQGQNINGMHIYIRAGLKTHGEGQHDYPQFLADWSKLLTVKYGAVVDGSFHAPTAQELAKTDVIIFYKGDAGYMTDVEKADLEAFLKRGGGVVSFHDSLCGPDPEYLANTVFGGAKKHGEVNYTLDAKIPYTIVDKASPIMAGMSDFTLDVDESFYLMTWAKSPQIHVLANALIDSTPTAIGSKHAGEIVPQMWTYEHTLPGGTKPSHSFVWMQGHEYKNFTDPRIEPMIARGIAWAAGHPVNELVDYKPAPGRGGRGGGGN